jgi:hypothetical protein
MDHLKLAYKYLSLPQSIKNLSDNLKQFKSTLRNCLYAQSYSVDEYLNVNTEYCTSYYNMYVIFSGLVLCAVLIHRI